MATIDADAQLAVVSADNADTAATSEVTALALVPLPVRTFPPLPLPPAACGCCACLLACTAWPSRARRTFVDRPVHDCSLQQSGLRTWGEGLQVDSSPRPERRLVPSSIGESPPLAATPRVPLCCAASPSLTTAPRPESAYGLSEIGSLRSA